MQIKYITRFGRVLTSLSYWTSQYGDSFTKYMATIIRIDWEHRIQHIVLQ